MRWGLYLVSAVLRTSLVAGAGLFGCTSHASSPPSATSTSAGSEPVAKPTAKPEAADASQPAPIGTATPPAALSPEPTSGAPSAMRQEGSGRTDLDRDGKLDCWRLGYDGGNAYGWWTMSVRAPCDAKPVVVRLGGSFGEFVSVGALPKELLGRPRLIDGLLSDWFGAGSRQALPGVDGSFAWLIERYTSQERSQSHDGWHLSAHYTPKWYAGEPALPPLQVVALLTPSEQELGLKLARKLAVDDENSKPGPFLAVYQTHNHHRLRLAADTPEMGVHVTDHAIAVSDHRQHTWSWVFVSTDQYRLRTSSIVNAATDGKLVVAEISQTVEATKSRRLLVIDPRSGLSLWRDDVDSWKFDANGLQLAGRLYQAAELS